MKPALKQLLVLLTTLGAADSLHAQASMLVATDDAGGTQAAVSSISSLDFYDNGLFWTVFGGSCSGDFTMHPSLATMGFRDSPFPSEHYIVQGCAQRAVGGAVRDDTFAFYTTPGGVMRKPLGAGPNDSPSLIGLAWTDLNPGAMMVYNGRAYYSYHSPGGPIGGRGYFAIEYFDLPGAGGFFEPLTEVSHGDGLANVGRIKKMGVIHRRVQGGGPDDLSPFGLALTESGYLLRFFVDQTIPQWRTASVIATGVTDFAVRREQFFDPDPFRLFYQEDQLYVSVGTSLCPSDPPSRIITLDPITFFTTTVWTSAGYISSIAVDPEYIFASTYGRRQLGGIFGGCELIGPGEIKSKCLPASVIGACAGPDPDWRGIELSFAGDNLRSDGQWLYFTRGKQVRRMRNNSPAARQDLAALGLEAVQVIQDLNNSVRLVEGKRTIVRAYARVQESSSTQTDWFPSGQLRGFRNGVELPGPIFPMGNARITRNGDLSVLRPDVNLSFQFELPADWVRSGTLELRFTVNPNLATSEYVGGADALANNTRIAANIAVVQVRPPCFVFASIHSATGPNYWPWENATDFARSMERAKSLLPVADIHIHPTTERISDEHICLRTCDGPFGIPYPCGVICNDPFDLSKSEDWEEALEELAAYDSFDQNRPGCGRTHYVGAIHPATMNVAWGGLGERPGTHFIAVMGEGSLLPENTPWAGRTIAHEFGHNLDRRHVDQTMSSRACGGSQPDGADPSYPGDTCTIAGTIGNPNLANLATPLGFDMLNFKPIRPEAAGDLMSYAPNRWPSIFTYNAMLNALGPTGPAFAPAAAPPPGPYLLVRGILNMVRGTARLKGCYSLDESVADPAKVKASLDDAALQAGHGYRIRKVNAAGAALEETPLVLREIEDADESKTIINQFITIPAGLRGVQILRDGMVIADSLASANPPVMLGVNAVYDPLGPSLQITINATDVDADPLRFAVQFSNDNGATWRTLRVNEGSYSFIANPRFLPGGNQCRVRVIATDGFDSASGTSAAFALPGRGPEPFIGGVRDGQRLLHGGTESLLGFAFDAEEGSLPAASLTWNLAGPTPRNGTGPSLSLQGLSPGAYTATLTTTDAQNNSGASTLRFEVLPLVIAESSPPVVDGDASDAAYAGAVSLELPLSPKTKVRFVHAGGHLYAAFTDLPYGGPTIRGRVGLYIDVDGSADASVQAGDLAFYVNEDGVPEQYQGDGTQMQLKASPSSGFKAVISRGVAGWNAEFRIGDSLLGGWYHPARIGVFDQAATTIFVFGIPLDTPLFAAWPVGMAVNSPGTWAPAWLGPIAPSRPNLPPVARAEAPRYADANGPTTITLNGNASFDPEGAALTYSWTQLKGPSVALENATTATPAFTAEVSSPTAYEFQLVVNDGELDSAVVQVEVILSPVSAQPVTLPPTATHHDDGSVTVGLGWPGRAGDVAIIQASSDLVTWVDVATNTVSSLQVVLFTDAQAGLHPQRFYRLANGPAEDDGPSAASTALQFDGVNDMVTVLHNPALNALPLTIAFWLKTSNTNGTVQGLVSKYADNAFDGYTLFLAEGRVRGWYFAGFFNSVWDGTWGLDSGPVADGRWHHIALVVDGAGGRLYVDGTRKSSLGWTGTSFPTTSVQPLQFGRYFNYPVALDGQLDEIAMWNRALTEAEVNQLVPGKLTGSETGLIGYWSLDDGTGEAALDASSSAFHGALANGPLWVPSPAPLDANPIAGNALRFDGLDDAVEVASVDALNNFPLTITAWIKTAQISPGYVSVANKYGGGSGNGYSLHIHNGRLAAFYFRGDGASFIYPGDPGLDGGFIADGQWHHVAYVVDNGGGRIYVDGVLTGSLGWTGTPGPCTTTVALRFGPYSLFGQTLSLDGRLDEITLWSRGLNANEVAAVGRFSVAGSETDLIGYWAFDDAGGITATDATGNGRHGTLINGPVWVGSEVPILP